MAETHLIEIRAGRGEPSSLELRPGVELAPLSVGTGGAWQVSASGVKTVHVYLYFDGQTLFLQSADDTSPAKMDGKPVPGAWTPATAPCKITLANAELVFRSGSLSQPGDDDATVAEELVDPETVPLPAPAPVPFPRRPEHPASQPPPPPPKAARPFRPGAFVSTPDGESTRFAPVEAGPPPSDSTRVEPIQTIGAVGGVQVNVRPAAGAPLNRGALQSPPRPSAGSRPSFPETERPSFAGQPPQPGHFGGGGGFPPPASPFGSMQQGRQQAVQQPGGPPPGLLNVPPPSVRAPVPEETLPQKIAREWAAAPPLRKGLIGAFPLAFLGFLYVMFGGDAQPPPTPTGSRPPPSATAPVAVAATPPPPVSPPAYPPYPGTAYPPTAYPPTAYPPTAYPPTAYPPPYPYPTDPAGQQPAPPTSARPHPPPQTSTAPVASALTPDQIGPDAGQANSDHRERQAADFVATHAFDQAIRIYDQLAVERPQNPAFREAARILRQKLDAGIP